MRENIKSQVYFPQAVVESYKVVTSETSDNKKDL